MGLLLVVVTCYLFKIAARNLIQIETYIEIMRV